MINLTAQHSKNNFVILIKKRILSLFLLLIGIMPHVAFTQTQENSTVKPVLISKNQAVYYIDGHLEYFKDKKRAYDHQQIINGEADALFQISHEKNPHFGFFHGYVWLKLSIWNPEKTDIELMLELNNAPLEEIDFFYQTKDTTIKKITTGTRFPFKQRPVRNSTYVFPIKIPADSQQTFYLRIDSVEALAIPLSIRTTEEHVYQAKLTQLALGLVLGILVSMTLYNLFLFVAFRDSTYLYYVLYVISSLFFHMAVYGVGYQFWPEAIAFNIRLRDVSASMAITSLLFFVRVFFQASNHYPRFNRLLIAVTMFSAIPIFTTLAIGPNLTNQIIPVSVLLCIITIIGLTAVRYKQGYKPARFFLLSWIILSLSAITFPIVNFGLIEYNILIQWSFQIGTSLQAIFLSFALADRINLLRAQKFESDKLAKDAQEIAKTKSEFLAKMSHEIRTPINGVLGTAELLRSTPLQPLQKHYSDVIFSSGKALLSVVNDILDHAKIEAGKMQLENIKFNLDKLINECIAIFTVIARDKELGLVADISPNVQIYLNGDPARLRQILLNLLSNAFKFTEHGEIVINVQLLNKNKEKAMLRFEVKDTGIGISEDQKSFLFQPFSQADSSVSRRFGGSGLGLTISRELVELMGGEIGIESQPGKGSTFWFTAEFEIATQDHISETNPDKSILQGKKLLIIDDHETFGLVVKSHASNWGVDVDIALTINEASTKLNVSKAETKPYDFIILDIHLPDGNGLDLAKTLSCEEKSPPILLVTGLELFPSNDMLNELGVKQILAKPLSNQQLLNGLLLCLSQNSTPHNESGQNTEQFSRLRVLVAEDNSVNQLVINGLLKNLGITATIVSNGLSVVQEIEKHHSDYDVILMDCEMPELDGYKATKKIRTSI